MKSETVDKLDKNIFSEKNKEVKNEGFKPLILFGNGK
ncbi:hypothetical protein LCGC14_0604350 [marine sediment metagenome]|uniref:Uncharacterized protein n=1 Tax=marine sediment metagenome TaxID=412755 RepID=A0A0F9TVN4_9ZZZZ|nr:MAG: hypothetical protein Lokiarch_20330 [Candidatus Lokiarchaeum sp. GC14_75]